MNTRHWLDEPRNAKRIWRFFLAVLVATVLAETIVVLHPHFRIDALPAFHAIFGFVACAAMIVVAKLLGSVLKRPDTYYGAEND